MSALAKQRRSATAWRSSPRCGSSPAPARADPSRGTIPRAPSERPAPRDDTPSVTLCTVEGGGQQWPGTTEPFPLMGHATQAVDATEAAVTFFREHGL